MRVPFELRAPLIVALVLRELLERALVRVEAHDLRARGERVENPLLALVVHGERDLGPVGLDHGPQGEGVRGLRLLDGHFEEPVPPVVARIERRVPGPLREVVEVAGKRRARFNLEGAAEVHRLDGLELVLGAVAVDRAPEDVVAEPAPEAVEDPRSLGVGAAVEDGLGVGVAVVHHGAALAAVVGRAARLLVHVVLELVGAVLLLVPERLEVGGEPLVEPDVRPVAAREEVAPPLMGELVRDEAVRVVVEVCALVVERPLVQRGGGDVLHAAPAELLDRALRVLVPGVLDADLLREELEHGLGVAEDALDLVLVLLGDVEEDRLPVPLVLADVELPHDERDQVGDVVLVLRPVEARLLAALLVGLLDELPVREGLEARRNVRGHLGRLANAGRVDAGDPVAVRLGLSLGVDLERHVRLLRRRRVEVEPCARIVHRVGDLEPLGLAALERRLDLEDRPVVREGRGRRLAPRLRRLDRGHVELDRVEPDGREVAHRLEVERRRPRDRAGRDVDVEVEGDVVDRDRSIRRAPVGVVGRGARSKQEREREDEGCVAGLHGSFLRARDSISAVRGPRV